jgi:serine/threonine-protein kinase
VAVSATGAVIAWYEAGRLRLASIDRNGLGEPISLAHVTGLQPPAEVVPSLQPKQWYVAWRNYEAGHLESFVIRVECP